MLVLVVIGVLIAIALPSYQSYMYRAKIASAEADIVSIQTKLEIYNAANSQYPPADTGLAAIGWTTKDPWGNAYVYLSMDGASTGQKRKDKSLHPLNSDYDLYSLGQDGKSSTPLTASSSQDDIIRANDGGFIGLGADY